MGPDRERHARQDERDRYPGSYGRRSQHRPPARALEQAARRAQCEQRESAAAHDQPPDRDQPLDTPEVLGAPKLCRAEVGCRVDRHRLDQATPGAEDERGRPCGYNRHREGQPRSRATTFHASDSNGDPLTIALLSDVHGNLPAFRAVLDEVEQSGAGAVWFLGDLVGYGAQPDECVELAAERCDLCLAGNHDLGVLDRIDIADFSPPAAAAALWTRERAAAATIDFLGGLEPLRGGEAIGLYHASPRDPVWEYVLSSSQAGLCIDSMPERVAAIGHTHVALRFTRIDGEVTGEGMAAGAMVDLADGEWLVNPGSVGQPRDGDRRAAWLLLDPERWTAEWRRTEYPIEEAANAIEEAGLPRSLGERLYIGQ